MTNLSTISNVLVIDDDEFLLGIIRKKLSHVGYRVTISNNVHDAIFKIGMTRPDLIMLDIIMPDINGIEFMSLIQSRFSLEKVPVILMSSLKKQDVFGMGYTIGAVPYLEKPFNVNQLPVMVQQMI